MVVATPPAMTAEQFFTLHGTESHVDLIRGQIVRYIRVPKDTELEADVCHVIHAGLPPEQKLTDGILEVAPELVIEVRSPSDLWTDALGKMLDYLRAGVAVVVILDPKTESASVFRTGTRQEVFEKDQTLTLPDVLPGFAVPVARFFEE